MKAFLSHSSKDKGFVENVVTVLRPGTYELDAQTFDFGLINSQAIIKALESCDLYCLFLSSQSVNSSYVDFETLLGVEFFASGRISGFLAICLDEDAFKKASKNARYFNVVRKGLSAESAARLIQGHLISAANEHSAQYHPFIGREDEMKSLIQQVSNHERPPSKALYLSGNFGSGRRTIAKHFYNSYYPQVGQVFPVISIESFAGLEELHRTILTTLRPTATATEFLREIERFNASSSEERVELVARHLNDLLPAREAAFLLDNGGLLADSGSLVQEMDAVLQHLDASPHPPVVFISPRMIPKRFRRSEDDISYQAVKSLAREATEQVISLITKGYGIKVSPEALNELVELSDSHPFNIYRMVEELTDSGLELFLANPSDFIDWKHRQSSEYLGKITLETTDVLVLGVLKIVPELDFTAIVGTLEADASKISRSIATLVSHHVIEAKFDSFMIAPPLRVAVERDRRIRFSNEVRDKVTQRLANSLSLRLEDGTAPVVLIDSTVLACLQGGNEMPSIISAFLLPSHYVWMAKRNYDDRNWSECIRYGRKALEGSDRLSMRGVVGARRFMCLASARIGDQPTFVKGVRRLREAANDNWAKSNIAFLEGFNSRLNGQLPKAESHFRKAYNLSPGNFSAAREMASICLERGNLVESEQFAREAHQHVQSNPYIVDILVSVLIRKFDCESGVEAELEEMFSLLEQVGEEGGRSFYTTRKAEFEHLWGSNSTAMQLIEQAIARTPNLFEPHRLHAEILLKAGNKVRAGETIRKMRDIVNSRNPDERRKNYRQYLQTRSHYLREVGKFEEAKKIFMDGRFFSVEERDKEIREIEIVQGYKAAGNKN